jgi:hypothetical protein
MQRYQVITSLRRSYPQEKNIIIRGNRPYRFSIRVNFQNAIAYINKNILHSERTKTEIITTEDNTFQGLSKAPFFSKISG